MAPTWSLRKFVKTNGVVISTNVVVDDLKSIQLTAALATIGDIHKAAGKTVAWVDRYSLTSAQPGFTHAYGMRDRGTMTTYTAWLNVA